MSGWILLALFIGGMGLIFLNARFVPQRPPTYAEIVLELSAGFAATRAAIEEELRPIINDLNSAVAAFLESMHREPS
jgi:hypothetical protein